MTEEAKKPAEEQELVPIVDDSEDEQTAAPEGQPAAVEPPAQDARVDNSDDDDDEGDDVPAGASDDERENINRKRRQQRREGQRRARERQEHMLAETIRRNQVLEQRLAQLEKHTVTSALNDVDQRIARAEADAEQALSIHAAAIEAGNGKDAATAQRIREAATEEARRLKVQREQFAAEVEREQVSQPAQPSGPDPRVVSHATNWIEANPWYDPNLGNDESKIAKQLDEQLVREGYNPASREHWAELTNRLNHVFSAAAEGDDAPADGAKNRVRKGPPTSSTRETGGRQLKPNEIYIAPERKQAMMEAGIWDDPVRRQRALKEYQRFDAENSAR